MSLHGRIMNIRARRQKDNEPDFLHVAYKEGHRDARHAAAELADSVEIERDNLNKALRDLLASHDDLTNWANDPSLGRPDVEWSLEIAEQARAAMEGES